MRLRNLLGGLALSLLALGTVASAQAQTTVSTVTVTNKAEQAAVGGKVTVGDTVSITVQDSGLPGGQEVVNYVVVTGDTKGKIATGLVKAINADTNLAGIGVSAKRTTESSKALVNIFSLSPNTSSYSGSVNSGGTETLTFSVNNNVAENATIGGTATAGDVVSITVTDPGLTGGQQVISYTVTATDTPTSIAAGLAANATANTVLKGIGITATSASQYVTIKSLSLNTTAYSASVAGTTETIALSVNPNSTQDAVLGGTPAANNVVGIGISDAGLNPGEFVSYLVKSGDTPASISCSLSKLLNADANLKGLGITSTCNTAGFVAIKSNSPNQTSAYEASSGTPIICTKVTTYTGPGVLKACGSASSGDESVQNVASTLQAMGNTSAVPGGGLAPDAAAKLNAAKTLVYYVYGSTLEYSLSASSPTGSGTPPLIVTLSPTAKGGSFIHDTKHPAVQPYTVIVENYGNFKIGFTFNTQVIHTTAHETGHQLDWIYGGKTSMFSLSSAYKNALNYDLLGEINPYVPSCDVQASDRQSLGPHNDLSGDYGYYGTAGGFFGGTTYDSKGNVICTNGTSLNGYSGNNLDIMEKAYPQIGISLSTGIDPNGIGGPNQEMFAEEYAFQVNFWDVNDSSYPITGVVNTGSSIGFLANSQEGGAFTCSLLSTFSMVNSGSAPTSTQLNNAGIKELLKFSGDTNSIVYGPPAQANPPSGATGFVGATAKTLHNCAGNAAPGGGYSFGT